MYCLIYPHTFSLYKLMITVISTHTLILTKNSDLKLTLLLTLFFEFQKSQVSVLISFSFHHHQASKKRIQRIKQSWSEGDSRFRFTPCKLTWTVIFDFSDFCLNLSFNPCCLMFTKCVWCFTKVDLSLCGEIWTSEILLQIRFHDFRGLISLCVVDDWWFYEYHVVA